MEFLRVVFCAALMGLISAAHGAVIYDEAVNGDAPSVPGPGLTGATINVPNGLNDILGVADGPDDYILIVPTGGSLLSIRLNVSGGYAGDFYGPGGVFLDSWSDGDPLISGPFGPGTYKLDNIAGNGQPYRWTLDAVVSDAVPEPASLALLGLGLAGLGWSRRKSKNS